jgi:benzodiazapine receptor
MATRQSLKVLQAANIVAFIGVIVVNTLASTVGLNGVQTGVLSDEIPNLFVPAGLTFSIWGVIYIFLLLFTLTQARGLFSAKGEAPAFVGKVGWLMVLSSAANIGWLLLWHWRQVGFSQLAMLALLASLIAISLRFGAAQGSATPAERWFARIPFSVYLGWITVATIANATALLVKAGWNGFGLAPEVWTVAVIVVAVLITLVVLATRRDAAYALVVTWALAGIALKRSADHSAASTTVGVTAMVAAAVVVVGIVIVAVRSVVVARRTR